MEAFWSRGLAMNIDVDADGMNVHDHDSIVESEEDS